MPASISYLQPPVPQGHRDLMAEFGRIDGGLVGESMSGIPLPSESKVVFDGMHMIARHGIFTGDIFRLQDPDITVDYYRADPDQYQEADWRELVVNSHDRVAAVLGYTAREAFDLTGGGMKDLSQTDRADASYKWTLHVVRNTVWTPWQQDEVALAA